jgi:Zinc carboxypeptidase
MKIALQQCEAFSCTVNNLLSLILRMNKIFIVIFLLANTICFAQQTVFEKSNGIASATYKETIDFYKNQDKLSEQIYMKEMGATDAAYPLHIVLVSADKKFDPANWHKQNKVVIMINNGIHAGEPDGIDASMMLVRDIKDKKITLPSNVVLAIIPVYNIGGCLNRNTHSRVSQNGPIEYGFRGNSQNLDLNRDFTKNDSKESKSFAQIFHWLNPDIFIDNHVSDGADFQHTMTLITTQYEKLGEPAGAWLRNVFEPQIYAGMKEKKWDLIPYVEFEVANFDKGINMFYETPRYSSGYAALFGTFAFIPETHMLKPYKERVQSTYDLLATFVSKASLNANDIKTKRKETIAALKNGNTFPLKWVLDKTKSSKITFNGYAQDTMVSEATGLKKMYYDHKRPYTKEVTFFSYFKPENIVEKPKAYIIPKGWGDVIERLQLNNVQVRKIQNDTSINVNFYKVDEFKSRQNPYEKHHPNDGVKVTELKAKMRFLKGDFIIEMNQTANRYITEMLEPTGDDSFFAWNFFDAILQQKEGYSDYRWEDLAAAYLKTNNELQKMLTDKKSKDEKFALDSKAQLDFIYKNSPYYEEVHNRYPVYKILYN